MGLFDKFRRRVKAVAEETDTEALTAEAGTLEATEALHSGAEAKAVKEATGVSSESESEQSDEFSVEVGGGTISEVDMDGWEEIDDVIGVSESAHEFSHLEEQEEQEEQDEWDEIVDGITPSPFQDSSAKAEKKRRKERNKHGFLSRKKTVEKTTVRRPAGSRIDLNVLRSTTGRKLVEVAAEPRGSFGPKTVELEGGKNIEVDLGGGIVEKGGRIIKESAALDELIDELESILLEADVGAASIDVVLGAIREELIGKRLRKGADLGQVIEASLKRALRSLLNSGYWDFDATIDSLLEADSPVIVMLVGVNGTGKTTTTAKLAHRLTKDGKEVILAAADTFRAGAIDQLETHAKRLGIRCISSQRGGDSAAISRDAIESAQAKGADVVIIDTAGRMQNKSNLMEELRKVHRVTNPHLVLFVGDALAGNDAVEQAVEFQKILAFDGFVLCKLDTDAKGGAALSVANATGKPIIMVGVGQGYDDLKRFDPDALLEEMFA
jgi:fused signal recognition particle receptor